MTNWHESLAVFDLETTGVDVETARVVTAYIGVLGADGAVRESRSWVADPGVEIPEGAAAVHGYTTERARSEGRPASEVVGEILASLRELADRELPLVVYNAPYDLTVMHREARRHGFEPIEHPAAVVDPLVIDKAVDRYRRGKRTLTAAAEHYAVLLEDAHDASADAIAAGRVAQALAARFPDRLSLPIAELHAAQAAWCAEQNASYEAFRRRTDPSFTVQGGWPLRGEAPAERETAPLLGPPAPDALF